MWPPAAQRSATTGIYTPERSDGPDLAALRRDWPRYDDWHREGIASDATMPPLGEGEPWMPATYLERLRRPLRASTSRRRRARASARPTRPWRTGRGASRGWCGR